MKRYILIAVLIAFAASVLIPVGPAMADTGPDTCDIISAIACRNLYEDGDWLIAVHYNIAWDDENDYPDSPSDDNFLIQFMNISGSITMAATSPYPYYNNGYSEGVASFYFTPDQVNILGLTWDTQYKLRLTTILGWVSPIVKYDYTLSDTDYCPSDDQDDNRGYLKTWVIDSAQSIATDWGLSTALTTVSIVTVLSETGEVYFLRVIPGLRHLCPDLFSLNIFCPVVPADPGTAPDPFSDRSEYDGTWIGDAIDVLGQLSEGNATLMINAIAMGIIIVLMIFSKMWLPQKTARPGMLLGLYTLPIGCDLHFTEYAVVGFVALCYTIFVAMVLFFNRG